MASKRMPSFKFFQSMTEQIHIENIFRLGCDGRDGASQLGGEHRPEEPHLWPDAQQGQEVGFNFFA